MRKKLLSTLLALCMVLALLPGTVRAADGPKSGKYGDLTWKYDSDTLTISGNGNMPNADIPSEIPWNNYSQSVSTVIIEEGVTGIGKYAFAHFSELSNLIIPDNVTMIGEWAFAWCSSLTSITIPGTVNAISSGLLYECINLSEVTIQNGVKYIESGAFSGCDNLTRISIPASVIHVGNHFAYEAFSGCKNLSEITVAPQNTEYASQDGALYTKEKDTLLFCPPSKTTFTIPNDVRTIGTAAFTNCTKLTSITIPDSVSDIGVFAFENCTSLTNIVIPEGTTALSGVFSGCSNLETIHLPVSLTRIYSGTFYNCLKIKSIVYSGTDTQWGKINIETGNAEIKDITPTFLNQPTPSTPDKPTTPDTPATPGTLSLTVTSGGLGKKVTVNIEAGHWLTVQTRRGGSISLTSIQAPASATGTSSVTFSASAGSVLQIWETATEMQFSNGVPTTPILNTATRTL